jgi:energy-coupling factor transport system permease protein
VAFLNDISLGRYIERDSVVHKLDPRTKGLCAILGMIVAMKVSDSRGLAISLTLIILLLWISKLNLIDLLKNFKGFTILFFLTFILHLLFTPTAPIATGLFYCGRIALLLSFSYLFMATTSPLEIADGLERTLKPLKNIRFPSHETAMVIAIALRFVPTILDEAKRIRDAQLCRGARLEGNIIAKINGFSAMLIPLFASAIRRADNLSIAMISRGYRGGEGRSSYIELRFQVNDFIAIVLTLFISVGLWFV